MDERTAQQVLRRWMWATSTALVLTACPDPEPPACRLDEIAVGSECHACPEDHVLVPHPYVNEQVCLEACPAGEENFFVAPTDAWTCVEECAPTELRSEYGECVGCGPVAVDYSSCIDLVDACHCAGCDVECSDSDCVCPSCADDPVCSGCNLDGLCNPAVESCSCADCDEHPSCSMPPATSDSMTGDSMTTDSMTTDSMTTDSMTTDSMTDGSSSESSSSGDTGTPAGGYGDCINNPPGDACAGDESCVLTYGEEGACAPTCAQSADCPPPPSGTAVPYCLNAMHCVLACSEMLLCPDGMECNDTSGCAWAPAG